MKLEGKVAVVTGASSPKGMGRAIALTFAREGANVIAVARRGNLLEELAADAKAQGLPGTIIAYPGDVRIKEDCENMLDAAVKEFGRLDILVNNAGIMDKCMPTGEASDELLNDVLGTNLLGPFYACRKAVNMMVEQGGGVIINTASIAGLQGSRGGATYTMSKHGLVGLTKNIAYVYALKGIRCNAICPGAIDTDIFTSEGMTNVSPFGQERLFSGWVTNPGTGSAQDIANAALFLALDDSKFVNGATIVPDGGWIAY